MRGSGLRDSILIHEGAGREFSAEIERTSANGRARMAATDEGSPLEIAGRGKVDLYRQKRVVDSTSPLPTGDVKST